MGIFKFISWLFVYFSNMKKHFVFLQELEKV